MVRKKIAIFVVFGFSCFVMILGNYAEELIWIFIYFHNIKNGGRFLWGCLIITINYRHYSL